MKAIITGLMSTAVLGASVGCMTVQPIGPLAGSFGGNPDAARRTPEGAVVRELGPSMAAVPLMRPAPPPPLPAMLVTPGDVTRDTHQDAARKLLNELEADRNAMADMPAYAEVSVVNGK